MLNNNIKHKIAICTSGQVIGLSQLFLNYRSFHVSNTQWDATTGRSAVSNGRDESPASGSASHLWFYPTPATVNYTWSLGFLSGVGLIFQIITGIFLAIHYTPTADGAFRSLDFIMREVHNGWFFRYAHANGASMMFITTYGHILRNIYYRTYVAPRQSVWYTGMLLYVLLMATAFLGYTLPWGQMSYWGATVITSMFTTVPILGEKLTHLFWGGPTINDSTIKRFFVLHAVLPILMVIVSIVHIYLVHKYGSSNPGGFLPDDHIRFASAFMYKDLYALSLYLFIYSGLIHFYPNALGHPDNYIKADPLVTPEHIVPEWYFSPYYAMLRAVPSKAGGAAVLVASILVLTLLPKIDRAVAATAAEHRGPVWVAIFWLFVYDVIFLGWLGSQEATKIYIDLSEQYTILYFVIVVLFIPIFGLFEKLSLDGYKDEFSSFISVENVRWFISEINKIKDEFSESFTYSYDRFNREDKPHLVVFLRTCLFMEHIERLDDWLFDLRHVRNFIRHLCRYSVFYTLFLTITLPIILLQIYKINPHA